MTPSFTPRRLLSLFSKEATSRGAKWPGDSVIFYGRPEARPTTALPYGAFDGALGFVVLVEIGDEGFGGQEQGGDAGGVAERGTHDLDGVDDAGLVHIDVLAAIGVVAHVARLLADLVSDDGAVLAPVVDDRLQRRGESAKHDIDADSLVP